MDKTNEQKAKELFYHFCKEKSCDGRVVCTFCPKAETLTPLIEMAEWKEKQMLEKAMKWMALNAEMYGGFNHGKLNEMVENFKKAMKEN